MGLLNGKVALITGAARGIGKAIALKYASEGADVAFTDLVINEVAEETVSQLEAFGVRVKAYASNAADFNATQEVVAQVVADFGRIDILVNNAGITKDGLVMRMSEQQWDAVIDVNMKSAFNFLHAVVPVMARQRSGKAVKDEFIKLIPLGRGASVDEIASVALFLASDLASYVTGQVIAVNGGMYC